ESTYNARVLYRRTWLNALGAEWLLGGQIGSQQNVSTELYQPLDLRHLFFVRAAASTGLRKVPLFAGGDRLGVYRIQENRAKLDASWLDVRQVRQASGVEVAPYSRAEARLGTAFSHGRLAWLFAVEGGTTLRGTLPLGDAFALGGPRRMAGFAQDQMLGGDYLYGRIDSQ